MLWKGLAELHQCQFLAVERRDNLGTPLLPDRPKLRGCSDLFHNGFHGQHAYRKISQRTGSLSTLGFLRNSRRSTLHVLDGACPGSAPQLATHRPQRGLPVSELPSSFQVSHLHFSHDPDGLISIVVNAMGRNQLVVCGRCFISDEPRGMYGPLYRLTYCPLPRQRLPIVTLKHRIYLSLFSKSV